MATLKSVIAVVNGQTISLTSNGDGTYSAQGTAPSASSYPEGGHYYNVEVTATYTTDRSTTVDASVFDGCKFVVKEKVVPTCQFTYPTNGAYITSASEQRIEIKAVDNENSQTSGYSGIDATSLSVTIDGETTVPASAFTATAISDGTRTCGYNFSFVPPSAQAFEDGNHTFTATVKDYDGNISTQASVTFVVDTTAPALVVTKPTDGASVATNIIEVAGTTDDATSKPITVKVYLDGTEAGTATVSGTTFTYILDLGTEGTHTIKVRATDAAGKYTESENISVEYSSAVPDITSVTITPNPADGGATFTITVAVV